MSDELCLSCCGRGQILVGMIPVEFAECEVCGGSGNVRKTPQDQL